MEKQIFRTTPILSGESGSVAFMAAISMFVLLGFAAFAIDFGYSYVVTNKLQNAADAAALAGASVMFTANQRCLSSGHPFGCCDGDKSGTCDSDRIDFDDVKLTAEALVDLNPSGGSPDMTTVTVEVGHYEFAETWDSPGTFYAAAPNGGMIEQMDSWAFVDFAILNVNPLYINAVKVSIERDDINRFFSKIWTPKDDIKKTVQATAYIGFAGTLLPGTVDEPVAICLDSITLGPKIDKVCNVGTMLNNNTQTSRWTDFTQDTPASTGCGTANTNSTRDLICDGNPNPIKFDMGISTTNGTVGTEMSKLYECWLKGKYDADGDGEAESSIDTDGDGKPDHPWQLLLPVIDCTTNPHDNCKLAVGAVVVDVVWINDKNDVGLDKQHPWIPDKMYNPRSHSDATVPATWTCTTPTTEAEAVACWESFQKDFNLQNNNLSGVAEWQDKSMYFLPECNVDIAAGGVGGKNFGVHAQYPVLVK